MDVVLIVFLFDILGKRFVKWLVSIVLFVFGGFRKSRLCCFVVVIVKVCLVCCCLIIFVRLCLISGVFFLLCCGMFWVIGSVFCWLRKLIICNSEWVKCVLVLEISEVLFVFCLVKIIWCFVFFVEIIVGIVFCMFCKEFVRVSLFKNLKCLSKFELICFDVVRILMVIGKLKCLFFFGKLVGVRLMVMCCGG